MERQSEPLSAPLLNILHDSKNKFTDFTLVGGTNLAYRFRHRVSIDIDFFAGKPISFKTMKALYTDLVTTYGKDLKSREGEEVFDHFSYITGKFKIPVKIDVSQNHLFLKKPILKDGINFLGLEDIGMLKIESMVSRGTNKDAFDLDYITDKNGGNIDIIHLWNLYKKKRKLLSEVYRNIPFNIYKIRDPLKRPEELKNIKRIDWLFPVEWKSEEEALTNWSSRVDDLLLHIKNENSYRSGVDL